MELAAVGRGVTVRIAVGASVAVGVAMRAEEQAEHRISINKKRSIRSFIPASNTGQRTVNHFQK